MTIVSQSDFKLDFDEAFAQENALPDSKQRLEAQIRGLDSQSADFRDLPALLWRRDYALQQSALDLPSH